MDRVALEKPKHVPPSPYTCDLIQEAFTKTLGGEDDWLAPSFDSIFIVFAISSFRLANIIL